MLCFDASLLLLDGLDHYRRELRVRDREIPRPVSADQLRQDALDFLREQADLPCPASVRALAEAEIDGLELGERRECASEGREVFLEAGVGAFGEGARDGHVAVFE